MTPHRDQELVDCERQLRHAGLPLLIQDYSASEDVFTRALPFLGFVAFVEVLGALDLDWPAWLNALAFLGGLALLLASFGVFNRWRGRPFSACSSNASTAGSPLRPISVIPFASVTRNPALAGSQPWLTPMPIGFSERISSATAALVSARVPKKT